MRRRSSRSPRASVAVAACLLGTCAAPAPPQPLSLPELDFSKLGDVLLFGNFSGISALTYTNRQSVLSPPNSTAEGLIVQSASDTYVSMPFSDGIVTASCLLDNHTAVIAGNFTSVLNITAPGLAKLDLANLTASTLGPQAPNGSVNALWCNGTTVYVGGSFEFAGSHGVAVWNSTSDSWSSPNFKGFVEGSSVNAIVPYGEHVVFGGSIQGLVPQSSGSAEQNRSGLLHPGMQPVSFNLANATGTGAQGAQPQDASNILCPYSGDNFTGWTAALDSTTGSINVTLGSSVLPTRIRLFNLPDGSGTKTWRLVTSPAEGIMNLTYTDDAGQLQSCSAYCPLPESNTTTVFRDFEFVNVVPTSSLRIELLDYYGSQAGLRGIQLFQAGQFAFANNAYNIPRYCPDDLDASGSEGSQTAEASFQGDWEPVADYMATNITSRYAFASTSAKLTPTFNDYTMNRSHYAVQLWTPGCAQTNVCSQRGQVNVSVYPGFGSPQSTILYQTNEDVKYDLVYNGTLQDGAYIEIAPTTQNQLPMQLVAYKASLIYVGSPAEDMNVTALFEYSPANFSSNSTLPVGGTPINKLGNAIGGNATVKALQLDGDSLLVGGSSFTLNSSNSNLLSLNLSASANANSTTVVTGIPSSEAVSKLYLLNGTTFALSNRQTYTVASGNASSVGIGAASAAAQFNLNGTNYWAFSAANSTSDQIALWNPAVSQFSPQSVSSTLKGHIELALNLGNSSAYVGSIQLIDVVAPGGVVRFASDSSVLPASLPFNVTDTERYGGFTGRAVDADGADQLGAINGGLYTATYLNSTYSILAGHFNATVSGNATASNAVLVNDLSTESLLPDGVDSQSSFFAAASLNGTAAIGGRVLGELNGTELQGLLIYNSTAPDPFSHQASGLGSNALVSALTFKPNTSVLLVGGQFVASSGASNGSCNGICAYSMVSKFWYTPKSLELGAGAAVDELVFETGDRVVFSGNFTVGDSATVEHVAVYDFSNYSVQALSGLPGPVSSLVVLSNSTQDPIYAVAGTTDGQGSPSAYLRWYNGSAQTWQEFSGSQFQAGTNITSLALVALAGSAGSGGNSSRAPLSGNQGLLVSGHLVLPNNGLASLASFDGSNWQGLYEAASIDTQTVSVNGLVSQYGGNLKGGVLYSQGTASPHSAPPPRSTPPPRPGGSKGSKHRMPTGHVVGIACGIGIGCVMVLTLVYLVVEFLFSLGSTKVPYQNLAQTKPSSDPMAGTKVL